MSMHEIESLIEDSVHLVASSKMANSLKRDFLYNLYNFQNKFDTGYTHFRLINTLLDLKYTYRIPLEKHPDYANNVEYFEGLDIKKSNWLPSKIDKKDGYVYAIKQEGGVFLYADAGSRFWQRLCEEEILPKTEHKAPEEFLKSTMIFRMLSEALGQKKINLVGDWYALLVNLVGLDLGDEDGFPKHFLDFTAQKEVNKIRQFGIMNTPFATKLNDDARGSLETPVLKEIEDFEMI